MCTRLSSYYEKFADGKVVCIDDEIPFEIPKGWEWCRISDLATIVGGYAYKSYDFIFSSQNQVLRLGNIKNDFLKLETSPVFISDDLAIKTDRFRCHLDDILVTMTGTRKKRDYFFSYRVKSINRTCFINQRVGAIRFYIKELSNYMIYALKAESILLDVFQYETGTANQGNLGSENIAKVLIPLPPLAEQYRIVDKIQKLLPVVKLYDSAQSKLNSLSNEIKSLLCKSILQEVIQGRLVMQDPNDEPASVLLERIKEEKLRLVKEGKLKKKDVVDSVIYKGDDNKYYEQVDGDAMDIESDYTFPDTWEVVKLSHICRLMDGEKKEGNYLCLDAKYLRGKSSGYILSKGKFVSTGDNIILVDGENSGEVFTVPHDGYMGSTFKQLWVSGNMHLPYVLHFIHFYKDLLRNSKKGAAIPHLNKEIFYSLIIGIPPYKEQIRIADKINIIFSEIKG